jgi:hypothetical protein
LGFNLVAGSTATAVTTTATAGASTAGAAAVTTTATTGTTATTVAATAASTTAKAAAARAGGTGFHRTGFVDYEAAATVLLAIHATDSGLRFSIAAHFHKAKAFGTASVTFHHDFGACDSTVGSKCLLQVFVTERIWQIANVKFVAHTRTPQNNSKRDGVQNRNQQTNKDLEQTRN